MVKKTYDDFLVKQGQFGKYVIAKRLFKKGEFIITFRGKIYHRKDNPHRLYAQNCHYLQITKDTFLGPTKTPDNYINHSCAPNGRIVIQNGIVTLYALSSIATGEEITFDYSTTMNDENRWAMACGCNTKKCRKLIQDFSTLPNSLRKKYISLGMVPAFVKENSPQNPSHTYQTNHTQPDQQQNSSFL